MEKQCCTAAYSRGAFLGSGFVSDPRGDFPSRSPWSERLAGGLVDLSTAKVSARVMQRRSSYMVYQKRQRHPGVPRVRRRASERAAMENARVIRACATT
ncbi:MAG: hypothetical protein ACLTMP_02855 [Eggerthella lenta]